MKLFPRKHYFLTTSLSQDEVERRLFENTDSNQVQLSRMFNLKSGKIFCGSISPSKFKIFRPAGFLNRNVPVIRGNIFTGTNETIIEIKVWMDITDYIFMTLVFLIILFSALSLIVQYVKDGEFYPGSLPVLCMFIFVILIHTCSIMRHNNKSKKLLQTLLEAEEINDGLSDKL